jgi:hypothetical protein
MGRKNKDGERETNIEIMEKREIKTKRQRKREEIKN